MKVRVFKRADDSVIYEFFSQDFQDEQAIAGVPINELCAGLPSIVCDSTDIPLIGSGVFIEQIYVNGSFSAQNMTVDTGWNNRLMPGFLIRKKRIEKIDTFLTTELAKVDPDMTEVMRKNLEKSNLLNTKIWVGPNLTQEQVAANDLQMAQLALSELDARVVNGEADKPVIRQKLQDKISALTL